MLQVTFSNTFTLILLVTFSNTFTLILLVTFSNICTSVLANNKNKPNNATKNGQSKMQTPKGASCITLRAHCTSCLFYYSIPT